MNRLTEFDLTYLGSPYTKYPAGIEQAFKDVSAIAAKMLEAGVSVYSPIAHTHPIAIHGGLDPLDFEKFLKFDAAMMKKSDALVIAMMESWEQSYGLRHEIDVFKKAGKPVFALTPATMQVFDNVV